jgi:hypothetical protein
MAEKYCAVQGMLARKMEVTTEEGMKLADKIEKLNRNQLRDFQMMVADFIFESGYQPAHKH